MTSIGDVSADRLDEARTLAPYVPLTPRGGERRDWLTISEVAWLLQIPRGTVRRRLDSGQLVRAPGSYRIHLTAASIELILESAIALRRLRQLLRDEIEVPPWPGERTSPPPLSTDVLRTTAASDRSSDRSMVDLLYRPEYEEDHAL